MPDGESRQRSPRDTNKLAAVSLPKKPPGMYGDGGGLWLQVSRDGRARSWIFRYRLHGKSHEMGLGSLTHVTLGQARDLAKENRKLLEAKPPGRSVRTPACAVPGRPSRLGEGNGASDDVPGMR